jgi:photosystem II stability/assembly factor-like uncharacterized protein
MEVSVLSQTSGWTSVQSPTKQKLYGVAYNNRDTVVAVGEAGTIIRSTDGGIQWKPVLNPATDALRAVAFNGKTGLAVGISGILLRTVNAGLNWTELPRVTHRDMYSVSMNEFMDVMTGHEGYIYRSKDDGQTWQFKNSGTFDNLFGVSTSGLDGIAVGGQGAIAMTVDTARAFGLTVLGNQINLLSLSGVSMANDTLGWVTGYLQGTGGIVLKTGDAGFVWTRVNISETDAIDFLWGVAALSPDFCTVVGSGGKIYNTQDHGRTWQVQPTSTTQTLNGVAFSDESHGIAIGDSGTILRTVQGTVTGIPENERHDINRSNAGLLRQNYPNPFNSFTTIEFSVSSKAYTTLKIVNSQGITITTLLSEELPEGEYHADWTGSACPSGIYFYQLTSGSSTVTRRMVLLK